MIRTVLTELGIFLIPFAVYALFLAATRSGLFVQTSWPVAIVARLALAAIVLVIAGLIGLALDVSLRQIERRLSRWNPQRA